MSINTTAAINARFAAINFTYEANTDGYLITNLSTGKTKQFNIFFLADIISGLEQVIENRKEQVKYEAEQARLAVMAETQVADGIALPQGEPVAETEAEVVETVATIETANLSNYDIVTMAEVNGFRVSLQANGEWHLIRKSDRQVTVVGYNLRDAVAIINPTPETFAQVEIERGYAAQEAEEHAAWVESQTEEVNVIEDDDTMTVMMAAMVLNDKRCGLATEEEIDEAQGVMVRAVSAELRARGVTFADDSLQDWICAGEFRGFETAESLADEWMSYDEEELSFIDAAELLHQASRGRVSDEMIEQARSVVVNALSIDLEAREVPFQQDDLRDWVACTSFTGNELIGSLADEWINENGITAPNWSAAANQYDAWLKQNYA